MAFALIVTVAVGEHISFNAPYAFYNNLVKPCETYWWSTLLHIQVQVNPKEFVS